MWNIFKIALGCFQDLTTWKKYMNKNNDASISLGSHRNQNLKQFRFQKKQEEEGSIAEQPYVRLFLISLLLSFNQSVYRVLCSLSLFVISLSLLNAQ